MILPVLAVALVACGGNGPGASSAGGGENNNIPGNAASIAASAAASAAAAASAKAAASTAAASTAAAASVAPSTGGGGGGIAPSDLKDLAAQLTPPNSTQTGDLSTAVTLVLTFTSTDSADSLKSFYDKAIADAGLTVIATTSSGGTYAWVLGNVSSGLGGSISVGPNPTGDGSAISIGFGNG